MKTQENTRRRRDILFHNLDTLSTFKYVPSFTNIFMLKSTMLTATELDERLRKRFIIASCLNITGVSPNKYLRVTLRTEKENQYLFNACKEIDRECLSQLKSWCVSKKRS